MCHLCHFFTLSTTIVDTYLTHTMTLTITGIQPEFNRRKGFKNPTKNSLKKGCLTPGLTHRMTLAFGSGVLHKMSVFTGIKSEFVFENFIHFSPVFLTRHKCCQIGASNMAGFRETAYSLNNMFTLKTVIL